MTTSPIPSTGEAADELRSLPELDAEALAQPDGGDVDQWPPAYKAAFGAPNAPQLVVRPADADGVAAVVRWAAASGRTVVAGGAGSNVVGATRAPADVLLSLDRLGGILDFDEVSQVVTVGAGMNGGELERWLLERGYTLGQHPQSLYISSVGGWIATRATGSLSALYGGVERAVCGLRAVLPDGQELRVDTRCRPGGGLDPVALMCGSEGTLGMVTQVSLVVHRAMPERRLCFGFENLTAGLDAQRELVHGGFPLGIVRLYNAAETQHILGEALSRQAPCLLLMTTTGPEALVDAQAAAIRAAMAGRGATPLPDDAGDAWFERRYAVERLMQEGNSVDGRMFDTIEVSVPWRSADACAAALESELGEVSRPFYLHVSHVYDAGACLYLMLFLEAADDAAVLDVWSRTWERALDVVAAHAGTIGHHHGIGAIRARRYGAAPEGSMHRLVKRGIDPAGTLRSALLSEDDHHRP